MQINSLKEFISNKKILTFLLGTFLFMINISVSYTVVPVYLASQNFNLTQIGISTTVYSLSAIFLRILLGPIADTKGRKFPLLISSFSFVISWLLIWLAPSYELHLIARIFQAIGLAMYMSTAISVVSDIASQKVLGGSMGIYRGFVALGFILGPVLAFALIEISFPTLFIATIIISIISFTLLTFLPETKTSFNNHNQNKSSKNYQVLLKNPRLLRYYLAVMTATCGFGIVSTNSALFLKTLDQVISPSIFLFFLGFLGMLSSLFGGKLIDKYGLKKVIIPGSLLALSGFLAMAFVESTGNLALIVVILAMGLGTNSIVVASITGIDKETSKELKATSFAIEECSYDGGFALGNMLFGFLVLSFGYSYGFLIIGLLLAISYLGIFIWDYRIKNKGKINKYTN